MSGLWHTERDPYTGMPVRTTPAPTLTVPEQQAQEAYDRGHGGGKAVLSLSPLGNGALTVKIPTEDDPSPRSVDLADALDALEASAASQAAGAGGLWDPSPDAAGAKWLGALDDALEQHGITRAEWARLMTAFGQLATARGWLGADGRRDLEALVRDTVGRGGRG